MADKTKVVFRVWKSGTGKGDVIALFPDEIENSAGHVLSFEHVGQHGSADYAGVISMTHPAKPQEYADLVVELKGRGYDLEICQRKPAMRRKQST